jgi:hypothetical protein
MVNGAAISLYLHLYVPTVRTNGGRRPMVTPRSPLIVRYGSRLVAKTPSLIVE